MRARCGSSQSDVQRAGATRLELDPAAAPAQWRRWAEGSTCRRQTLLLAAGARAPLLVDVDNCNAAAVPPIGPLEVPRCLLATGAAQRLDLRRLADCPGHSGIQKEESFGAGWLAAWSRQADQLRVQMTAASACVALERPVAIMQASRGRCGWVA